MDYFDILDLNKEPFSNSPDPEFFYEARPHVECLQKLELSLRLRRGLSVVTGEVGTGKTTLCRHLIRRLAEDDKVETHLILDPSFSSPSEFLQSVAGMFSQSQSTDGLSNWQLKEMIKKYLFHRGVDEKRIVILIIDEGQRLPHYCLEVLREFLNYETNEYKLLQIVIFAQSEFDESHKKYRGFADRINLYYVLGPLDFQETKSLIRFRLERATEGRSNRSFFSSFALKAIYRASEGYPRRIIHLCHQVVLTVIIQNRSRAGWFTARSCVKRFLRGETAKRWQLRKGVFISLFVLAVMFGLGVAGLKILELQDRPDGPSPPLVIKREVWTGPVRVDKIESEVRVSGETAGAPERTAITENAGAAEEVAGGENVGAAANAAGGKTDRAPEGMAEAPVKATLEGTPEKALAEVKEIPEFLGSLTVDQGEILARMVRSVYGTFNEKYLKAVCDASSQIDNPDQIELGQRIFFPAIPVKPSKRVSKFCWVQVAEKEGLEEAYLFLRSYPEQSPPVHLVPSWNRKEGLRFHILYRAFFADEESAQKSLGILPPEKAWDMIILVNWEEDRVFFSDPFSWVKDERRGSGVRRQWSVVSGQWSVIRGQKTVARGRWSDVGDVGDDWDELDD